MWGRAGVVLGRCETGQVWSKVGVGSRIRNGMSRKGRVWLRVGMGRTNQGRARQKRTMVR